MRILIYKRTHVGDPNAEGRFGVNMCMGRVRDYDYDAVIGVGGIGAEPMSEGIARKINWVGIGPKRHASPEKRACEVTFKQFLYLGTSGPLLVDHAPNLAIRLYEYGARLLLNGYSQAEKEEAEAIVEWSRRQTSNFREISDPAQRKHQGCSTGRKQAERKCGC